MMTLDSFLQKLNLSPELINFSETQNIIASGYRYQPTAFTNGQLCNQAGENEGSCRLFYFAQLQNLDQQQTLACFGQFYRDDVLGEPDGDNHQNIRHFMNTSWAGINFDGVALRSLQDD